MVRSARRKKQSRGWWREEEKGYGAILDTLESFGFFTLNVSLPAQRWGYEKGQGRSTQTENGANRITAGHGGRESQRSAVT